jgi:peptidoglycan/xylan/chitin deacetylase (PgdA/CDA1 family)
MTATPLSTETLSIASPYGPRPTLNPLPPQERGLIFNGSGDKLVVALTFDAGQTPKRPAGYDREIERVLLETETPATIFLGGDWMRYHPEETAFLFDHDLFELGNHGWAHIDFQKATVEEMLPEIEETQQMMWNLLGFQPTLFRFPYGTYTEEALRVVEDHGLRAIQWDVVSGDPDPNVTAEAMIPWVVNQVEPGSIIIMHMNGRGWNSAEALPTIIETLRAEGYTFVTISELLGLE